MHLGCFIVGGCFVLQRGKGQLVFKHKQLDFWQRTSEPAVVYQTLLSDSGQVPFLEITMIV